MTPDDLVEIEQIKLLKHRYCRLLDQKRFDELADLFVADATAGYGGGARELTGRDAIVDWLRSVMAPTTMLTIHQVSQPEIELAGAGDEATGCWALQDVVVLTDADVTIRGASYYEDRYAKVDGAWRIRHTGYKRVYETLERRGEGVTLTADWWATGGRSSLV
ncbi:MAG TPA: nuclear transport factor 2 family protein [Acidimicrobiales bacterium]